VGQIEVDQRGGQPVAEDEISPRQVGDLGAALSTGHTRTPRLAFI